MMTIEPAKLRLRSGDQVLDLGCGEGRHSIGIALEAINQGNINVVGVDLSVDDLLSAKNRSEAFEDATLSCNWACADGLKLPFADNTFQKIICSEVLEHIPDYKGMLNEIERVLKPNGLLAVSVPRRWPEKICWWLSEAYHKVEGGHIRIFRARELREEISAFGFQHYDRHWAHALHAPFWWLKCVFWNSQDSNPLLRAYHRLLVWDLMDKPWLTQTIERLLNPLMGKSVVMYFERNGET
ncbi:MAG: class I SAM-dependent methyltransferase [Gammaproteobacteria bacterium]|nr:class I SAM-dependent methyltransferase [Gammaproteobacteria bacterium]MBT8151782.1 class I SAM-dependent methyltransferase [Gammaproteobacteria bacterium]NNM12519.1 class I SAM-dependent methyltransferase [Pseudomonadales bacterium]RZV56223.1 MAG: class I SAM-dependent methyltransferase [Pseudomonadales bacterium]